VTSDRPSLSEHPQATIPVKLCYGLIQMNKLPAIRSNPGCAVCFDNAGCKTGRTSSHKNICQTYFSSWKSEDETQQWTSQSQLTWKMPLNGRYQSRR